MNVELASIILPIYRQAGHVEGMVRGYERGLEELAVPHETILVFNGPDDGSLALCRKLEREFAAVRVVEHDRKGWGSAVRRGLLEAQGDLLCYTNSARTSVETLMMILGYSLKLPGIVIKANRKTRDSVWRHLGSLIYNLQCRALFDLSNFDINGTPKAFPRSSAKLLDLRREDDLIDVEFLAICRAEGYLILEVPVIVTKRHDPGSTTNIKSALKLYWGAMLLRNQLRREGRLAEATRR